MSVKPRACRARVVAVRALAETILEAELAMEEPREFAFEAGQWISVPFGPKIVRAYSIASTPRSRSRLTLTADVGPGGIGSRWFRSLAPGMDVTFKGPLGGFVWTRGETRRPLFVAEEIGIVPIRSIVLDLHETGRAPAATLVHEAREETALAYAEEFAAMARRSPAFAYHPIVARGDAPGNDAGGAIAEAVDRLTPSVEGVVAYVSGGEGMIHRVRDLLVAKGLERKAVKWEKFW